jgi:translin
MGLNLVGLKTILKDGKKELIEINKVRETTQKSMRKTLRLSKQAILSIHQKKFFEAKRLVGYAKKSIAKLKIIARDYPEIIFTGMYSATLQEYCEANILLDLIQEKQFITPRKLEVPYAEYILGLADVIGEYRRLCLDALREDLVERGEGYFIKMEEIYLELLAMDEAYMLVHGLRRKCDVARKIIESTRGDITQAIRRKSLEKSLIRVEKIQKKKQTEK